MQQNLKKEIQIKFTVDGQDAVKALNLINKEYSAIAEKSSKIVSGNNEISKSLKGITGASQLVSQAFGQLNNSFDKSIQLSPAQSTSGTAVTDNSGVGNEYEIAKKQYDDLNKLALQHSDSLQKIDDEGQNHKVKDHGPNAQIS